MTTTRSEPWCWVTWITGVLSGDSVCYYAPWFKAHFQAYVKRASTFTLDKWKGEHADVVRAVARDMVAEGWTITVEGQNKFKVKGEYGVLSGQPDIIGVRSMEMGGAVGTQGRIVDVKTGRQKASDRWQVMTYLAASPRQRPELREVDLLLGQVVYLKPEADGTVNLTKRQDFDVPVDDTMIARVWRAATGATSDAEPGATPSEDECRFCDIVDCRFREETPVPVVDAAGAF